MISPMVQYATTYESGGALHVIPTLTRSYSTRVEPQLLLILSVAVSKAILPKIVAPPLRSAY